MGNKRAVVAVASCFFGIGIIFWGFRIGSRSPQQEIVQKTSTAPVKPKKSLPAWHVALGNVVVFAPELGFNIKTVNEENIDSARIRAKIESQLTDLRDLYRDESEKNSNLMGGILLQLEVSASGDLTSVRELASRIPDGSFKEDLLETVAKWDFAQMVTSPVIITCPLVLVREGMDIRTVLTWEKSLGLFDEKSSSIPISSLSRAASNPPTTQKQFGIRQIAGDRPGEQKPVAKSSGNVFEVKATTLVRKEPSYKSSSISQISKGAKIVVAGVHGEWLEIHANGSLGFIRKEFASPVD